MREIAGRVHLWFAASLTARPMTANNGSSSSSRSSGTPGLKRAGAKDQSAQGYEQTPPVRLADGSRSRRGDLARSRVRRSPIRTRSRPSCACGKGVIPAGVRFQVEYPTPLAAVSGFVLFENQDRLELSSERVLFADLDRLMAAVP